MVIPVPVPAWVVNLFLFWYDVCTCSQQITFSDPVTATWINNFQEIDYTKEAANAELFASNFKNMDYVKVPTIYWDYTTPQV